jgi:putative membrane protein
MHWMNGYGGWFMGGGMWLLWIVLVALVLGVLWTVAGRGGRSGAGLTDTAEEILKKRYARGEISREEFQVKLHELREQHG